MYPFNGKWLLSIYLMSDTVLANGVQYLFIYGWAICKFWTQLKNIQWTIKTNYNSLIIKTIMKKIKRKNVAHTEWIL